MGCHDTYDKDIDHFDVVNKIILNEAVGDKGFNCLYKGHNKLIQVKIVLVASLLKTCVVKL